MSAGKHGGRKQIMRIGKESDDENEVKRRAEEEKNDG